MNEEKRTTVMGEIFRQGYAKIFYENWPTWLGGLLIGIMSVLTFAWARPWGVAGGLRNWGDNLFYLIGVFENAPIHPLFSTSSLLTLGLLLGALASSLLSKQFAFRKTPKIEVAKGIIGGILMGVGASMAGGCNVGGFFSATSAMSLSGLTMFVGLFVGAYLGLRYLYWELEHIPSASGGATSPSEPREKKLNLLNVQPYIGVVILLATIIGAWIYGSKALTVLGGLLLCGVAFGVIIQRTRFCFVRCFREPFMTGEAKEARGVAISIIVSILGFAILKWGGLRPEMSYVPAAFWFGGLVGGIVFGVGMVIAGGCGSGSVWRCGEGQSKLLLAVIFFAISISLFEKLTASFKSMQSFLGTRVYLPYWLGYEWSALLIIVIMLIFYIVATWNEKTEKFVVEL